MNQTRIYLKSTFTFILSIFLLLSTILPVLSFFASQETMSELLSQIGVLRIFMFYIFLGIIAVITWILSNEILAKATSAGISGLSAGFALFAKIVSMLVSILMITLHVISLFGTILVYYGVTILGLDFGNVRFYQENSFLLVFAHLLTPFLISFFIISFQKKKRILNNFGNIKLIEHLSVSTNKKAQYLKAALLVIAAFYLVVAWARPQLGTKLEMVKREGVDIIIALDVSYSMMAEDITPNRLEKAKHEIETLIDKMKGDRVGLIAFAGIPFIQCPLTLDYGAAKIFLDVMSPDLIPEPGTALGKAIEEAIKAFEQTERKHKVLVLITDGEDHQGESLEAAKKAESEGIVIYTVGIGTAGGVPIPLYGKQGGLTGFRKDRQGKEVVSKLDELSLEKVALQTNGKYYRASSNEIELDKIYEDISKMEKKELASKKFSQYEDRFQFVLIFALFLLIIELFISERKNAYLNLG